MLFKDKYRIESARLREFDYSSSAWYYVTICTAKMYPWFGKVRNEKIELSLTGKIVLEEWIKTKEIRTTVDLDEFAIMPNHLHGIIIINDSVETSRRDVSKTINVETTGSVVSDNDNAYNKKNETTHRIVSTTLKPNSLGSIIGQFKSVATKRIRKEHNKNFSWQPRFYDHIIRNEKSLLAIRKYIRLNPLK